MTRLYRLATSVFLAVAVTGAGMGPASARAQEATVSGRVVDGSTLEPLEGVAIRVRGTQLGTLTSSDGSYRLTGVPDGSITLTAQRIGFRVAEQTVTVASGATVTVDFSLQSTAIALENIVASVEAGAVRRREMGTDISQIDAATEVEKGAVEDLTGLIRGRGESVTVTQGSGQVGTGSRVRVRGVNSLTQDNVPLIIVDGIRYSNSTQIDPTQRGADPGGLIDTGGQTTSRFEDLNPEDIESVQVVKGPTAAALYGSEAAAGVLVIKTKRGTRSDRPQIRLRTRNGFVRDHATYPDNYGDLTTGFGVTDPNDSRLQGFRTAQNPVTGMVYAIDNPLMDEDSSPFQNGYQGTFAGSVTGGGETAQYYGSVEYQRLNGVFQPNKMDRVRGRANVSVQPDPVVNFSINTGYTGHSLGLVDTSTRFGYIVQGVLGTPANSFGDSPGPGQGPCLADVLTDGAAGNPCAGRNGNFVSSFENLALIDQGEDLDRFTGSAVLDVQPTEWLTFNATGGIDEYHRRLRQLIPYSPEGVFGGLSRGLRDDERQYHRVITADMGGTARLNVTDGLTSTTSGGVQGFFKKTEIAGCEGDTFSSTQITSCSGALITRGFSNSVENVELGAYAQQRFGWHDWIFASGAIRVDDNSALGANTDAIVSPSANASVVLSDAPFWSLELVNVLRLRFAWGKASQSPDQFAGDRTYVNAPAVSGGQLVQGLSAGNPGNPNLTAERNEEFEAGLDARLLDSRVGASFTYYHQRTTGAIVPVPVAPSLGFTEPRFVNLAELKNEGIELSVNARPLERENVSWDLRFILSTSNPLVTKLGRPEPIFFPSADVGTTTSGSSQIFATGLPPGAYVSHVVSQATRDDNGNITTFTLAAEDPRVGLGKRMVGSPVVGNQESLSTTLTLFRNFQVFTLFDRDGGNDLLYTQQKFRSPLFTASATVPSSTFSRRWAFRQTESPETQAEIEQGYIRPYVYDGSFIRWRELTLSYTVPTVITERFGLSNARVTLGARNLGTFTDFPGPDPESNIQGAQDNFVRGYAFEVAVPQTWFGEVSVAF